MASKIISLFDKNIINQAELMKTTNVHVILDIDLTVTKCYHNIVYLINFKLIY